MHLFLRQTYKVGTKIIPTLNHMKLKNTEISSMTSMKTKI